MDFYEARDNSFDNILPELDGKSNIEDFFDGCNVLVTGVTGFIGNLVVEKLLRCCPGIKKLYFFIRLKKNLSEKERALEVINELVFDHVRKQNPNFMDKIVVVASDCSLPNLGLGEKERKMVLDTNIVFHIAATLRFDDHYRHSFQTNVQATKDLLEIAKDMKHLKAFTYVSTAYAHVEENVLKEEFIKSKFSYEEMKILMEKFTDEQITALMPKLTGVGTTYSVMKSIAENVVQEYHQQLPIGIVRPSIVISTGAEPIDNWLKGLNGPTAMFLGVLLGIMRAIHIGKQKKTDLIPADKVASAIVAATWDLPRHKPSSSQMPVYNIVSCNKSPITWEYMSSFYEQTDLNHPNLASERHLWEPFGILTENRLLYNVLNLFLHIIPGIIMDAMLKFKGQKPLLMKLYRKAYYLMDVMSIYNSKVWEFDDDNLYAIWNKMTDKDRQKFNFSLVDFDWSVYYYNYARGLKVYLLKESTDMDSMNKCYKRRKTLKVVHYATCTLLILFGVWLMKFIAATLLNCYR
uniref:Fatty acyl-CoA reductase n=1 Tax=Nilaparvata lugens TaxID=108931 RepID=A0A3S7L458_NILLU|nr:fatty acyl-CoA reductase [Nilaparvata lugens]